MFVVFACMQWSWLLEAAAGVCLFRRLKLTLSP